MILKRAVRKKVERLGEGYYLSVADIEVLYNDCGELLDEVTTMLVKIAHMRKECKTPYAPPRDDRGVIIFRRPKK